MNFKTTLLFKKQPCTNTRQKFQRMYILIITYKRVVTTYINNIKQFHQCWHIKTTQMHRYELK